MNKPIAKATVEIFIQKEYGTKRLSPKHNGGHKVVIKVGKSEASYGSIFNTYLETNIGNAINLLEKKIKKISKPYLE